LSPALAIVPIAVPALPLTLNDTVALYSESDTFSTGPSLALAADDTPSITWSMSRPASAHLSALSVAWSFALMPSTIACATFSGPPEPAVLSLLKKNPGATKPVTPTAMSTTRPTTMPVLPFFGGAGGPPKPCAYSWPYWYVCPYCCCWS
jgi:hypothetical protein